MALDSFANLKDSIVEWLDRDDLTSQVEDFIAIAEARHKREVRIRQMIERCPIGVTSRYVDLPVDYLEAFKFRLLETPIIRLTNVNELTLDTKRQETEGTPCYYTVHSQIELDRPPYKTFNGEMLYYKELRPLSDANTTNALLERAPDIYLYSALSASAPFLSEDDRVATWESLYVNARDDINALDTKTIGVPIASVPGFNP